MGLGRRPVGLWSRGHSQGAGGTGEWRGTDPPWGPADTWASDPSLKNGQRRHFLSKAPICGCLCGSEASIPRGPGRVYDESGGPQPPQDPERVPPWEPREVPATGTQEVHARRRPRGPGDWCQEALVHLLSSGTFQMETRKLQTSRGFSEPPFMY